MGRTRRWQGCFGRLWHLLFIRNLVLALKVLVFGAPEVALFIACCVVVCETIGFRILVLGPVLTGS
jgi:hypothetical protein